jgi:hypothetical protein
LIPPDFADYSKIDIKPAVILSMMLLFLRAHATSVNMHPCDIRHIPVYFNMDIGIV